MTHVKILKYPAVGEGGGPMQDPCRHWKNMKIPQRKPQKQLLCEAPVLKSLILNINLKISDCGHQTIPYENLFKKKT